MLKILEQTSRTFYLPIIRLPEGLQEAVAAAYLCMRAIDEIEDHPELDPQQKSTLLQTVSLALQGQHSVENFNHEALNEAYSDFMHLLPEVTLRLGEWSILAPIAIAPRIWEATAAMAERMALWARRGWSILSQSDLDRYTFGVAGAVGLLLCDLWGWFEGLQPERSHAISFGRGLQAVNILRNRQDDLARGVDFYPPGWSDKEMEIYRAQAKELGKPDNIIDKIAEGKLNKFIKDNCLLNQPYVRDPDITVSDLLNELIAKIGENITVKRFVRFQVGES